MDTVGYGYGRGTAAASRFGRRAPYKPVSGSSAPVVRSAATRRT